MFASRIQRRIQGDDTDTKNIRIRHKKHKIRQTQKTSKLNINSLKINVNDTVLLLFEKVYRHFWRIATVTRVLPSRDSEKREAIVRIANTNTILKRPVNKFFAVENTYHDINQTDKAREQKFRL